jgi:hypothetical protein
MPQTDENFETNIVVFRPRHAAPFPKKHPLDDSANNICELLNLSQYELRNHLSNNNLDSQNTDLDNFHNRMRANLVVLIFLVALAGLAAVDVLKLLYQV